MECRGQNILVGYTVHLTPCCLRVPGMKAFFSRKMKANVRKKCLGNYTT